jgi:hypothetical protein
MEMVSQNVHLAIGQFLAHKYVLHVFQAEVIQLMYAEDLARE